MTSALVTYGDATRSLARRPLRYTAVLFLGFFVLLLSGALFFPLVSGADEAAHYIYSAAVVRGQAGTLEPTVPARIANLHDLAACIAFQPAVTAACQAPLQIATASDVLSQTNAGLYNPVFYAWTGLGSLVIPTEYGLYAARALSAVVTAAFLAWGLSFTARRAATSWPVTGAALLLTPMTLYVGMVLNPSAWEIATMFAVTVAGYQLFVSPSSRWGESHWMLLIAGSVLIVSRGLSPFFLVVVAAAVTISVPFANVLILLRRRSTWLIAAILAGVAALSALWVLVHGTNYVGVERPDGLRAGLRGIAVFYANYHEQITQMYGNLGWLELPSPHILSSAWLFFLGGFILLSFAASGHRGRWGILLAFAAATLIPGVLAGLQWSGFGWQGRYTLPLVAALLGLCAWSANAVFASSLWAHTAPRLLATFRVLAAGFFTLGATVLAVRAAHRYTVGDPAPWLATPSWTPPVPGWVLIAAFCAGLVVLSTVLFVRPRRAA